MSAMCWCTVLLEDKHVSSNAADRWQQFLHQQHVSIILPVDFSLMFNKNEADIIEFRYRNRDLNLTELLTVGRVLHKRRLTPMSRCLVATGAYAIWFCEFLGDPP